MSIDNSWIESQDPNTGGTLYDMSVTTFTYVQFDGIFINGNGVFRCLETNYGQRNFKYSIPTGYSRMINY